jgi:heme-degrading monooxygenase HmoA
MAAFEERGGAVALEMPLLEMVGFERSVLEVAVLDVRPGEADAFLGAFAEAEPLLARAAGYRGHRLGRCLERDGRYLLLVAWESLEHHTEGFRGSPDYARWKALLHPFYHPFPTVSHYVAVGRPAPGGEA